MVLFNKLIRNLFSFELLFTLFLFAWTYKSDPRFEWIPVDPTQLFFILSVCSGILVFLGEKKRFQGKAVVLVFSGILFVFYVLISLTWTEGKVYAAQKALYLSTLSLWTLIACAFIIASDKKRMLRFGGFLLAISVWIALESTLQYAAGSEEVINALHSNYLALGYTLGMGLLISAATVFLSGQGLLKRLFLLALSLHFMFLLLVLGGKGPLLSANLALLMPLLFRGSQVRSERSGLKKYTAYITVLFLALIFVSIYLYLRGSPTATLYRLLLFLAPGMGTSAGTRLEYYLASVKLWQLKPLFGHGIGSWPILMGLPDDNAYPHNLILEILSELGLTGLLLFGATVVTALTGFVRTNRNKNIYFGAVLLMLLVNALTGAMLSGDINDNRIIFAILGLSAFEGNENEREDMCSVNSP